MLTSVTMCIYLLSCNTDEAQQLYYGGCLLSVQSENEIEEATEVENKSDLICTSLSGCVHYLPVPVVTPLQTLLTGGFKIVTFILEKLVFQMDFLNDYLVFAQYNVHLTKALPEMTGHRNKFFHILPVNYSIDNV